MNPKPMVLGLACAIVLAPARVAARPPTSEPVRLVALAAAAETSVACRVSEIVGSNEKRGIDPKLQPFRRLLSAPPHSVYDTYRLAGQASVRVGSSAANVRLTTGGSLEAQLKERIVTTGKPTRFRLALQYANGRGARRNAVVVADEGQAVIPFPAEPYQRGVVLVALTCSAT